MRGLSLLCLLLCAPLLLSDEVKDVPSEKAEVGDVAQDTNKNEDVSEGKKEVPEEKNDVTEKENKVPEEKKVNDVTKDLEEAALNDLDDLNSFLLQIVLVPDAGDEEKIADKPIQYNAWMEIMEGKLKKAYEMANLESGNDSEEEPVVKIVKTELIKESESISLKILFYVRQPPVGPVSGAKVETLYKTLPESKLWEYTEREALGYPTALEQNGKNTGASRTISIIAFVLGWVCLAALIVILAYLGIKYRDGLKSLAWRIQHWSNQNRTGYSNLGGSTLGGEVHTTEDWRRPATPEGHHFINADNQDDLESKPKKKLRAPGGLLNEEMDEGDIISPQSQNFNSYGGTSSAEEPVELEMQIKDSTQLRLSDLASGMEDLPDNLAGNVTPPLTPKSMQKHLIKKYQEKQVEEQSRGFAGEESLTASNSEVFPEDFADCVEEEEIFQVKP